MSAGSSAATTSSGICPICKDSLSKGKVVEVQTKGAEGINAASVRRGDSLVVTAGCPVHVLCRRRYTTPMRASAAKRAAEASDARRSGRLSSGPSTSSKDCLFCNQEVNLRVKNYGYVKTDVFAKTILEKCEQRADDWAEQVKGRILFYGDLHAFDCIYHRPCNVNFRNGKNPPRRYQDESSGPPAKRGKPGRPKNENQQQAFLRLCSFLEEHDEEQFTMPQLEDKMREFLTSEDCTPYGRFYIKDQLLEHFGPRIVIAESHGRPGIVSFYQLSADIIRSFYRDVQEQRDEESKKRAIIETAAKLILSDIKLTPAPANDVYPTVEELTLESAVQFLPGSLRDLLNKILPGTDNQRKVASIGQALLQAARPRTVVAPLQIGLAAQLHHRFRSTFLLNTLNKMGFCSSYKEVLRFEKNAASCATAVSTAGGNVPPNSSLLFAADNVDHNTVTLDGQGTFHGMGMIAAVTPGVRQAHLVTRNTDDQL